jgi:predicted naringenin-chalcone synthase
VELVVVAPDNSVETLQVDLLDLSEDLIHQLIHHQVIHQVIRQVIHQVIHQVIRQVIHQVIQQVIHHYHLKHKGLNFYNIHQKGVVDQNYSYSN